MKFVKNIKHTKLGLGLGCIGPDNQNDTLADNLVQKALKELRSKLRAEDYALFYSSRPHLWLGDNLESLYVDEVPKRAVIRNIKKVVLKEIERLKLETDK